MAVGTKFITGIVGLIFAIVILVIVVPAQNQQLQITNQQTQQIKNQLNEATLNFIDVCMTTQSIADLNGCKQQLRDIQNKCKDPSYSVPACNDPRITQFFSTVDSKITYEQTKISSAGSKLNNVTLKMIDVCSQMNDPNNISTCKIEMLQIQQDCNSMGVNAVPACNDPRIIQIMNEQITQSSNVYDASSQIMESFINMCMIAQDNNTIQDCSVKARQMISLCQSTSVQACNDPRLQQIAEITTNSNTETQSSPENSSNTSPSSKSQSTDLITDAPNYKRTNDVTYISISGKLHDFLNPAMIELKILYPGEQKSDSFQTQVGDGGTFYYQYQLGPTSPLGIYTIQSYYKDSQVAQVKFELR
ncbi:MAG: hypothetical protein HY222_00715 [Thaumarchaeota archaeon]|nr:hypothetical protein [Nitrososphaerota archaeon]MBI3640907.1 hypothetical protein [Nitrososphaerota archaeon]